MLKRTERRKKLTNKHHNRGYLDTAELNNIIADVEQLRLADTSGGQIPLSMPSDLKSILKKPPQRILPTNNPQMQPTTEMLHPGARGHVHHEQMARNQNIPKQTKVRGYHGQHGHQYQMQQNEMFRPEVQGGHGHQMTRKILKPTRAGAQGYVQQMPPNMEIIHPKAQGYVQQMPPNMEIIHPRVQGYDNGQIGPLLQAQRPPDKIIVPNKISSILVRRPEDTIIITKKSIKILASEGFTDAILKIGKKEFSHQQINLILYYAASNGHIETMKLARRWGANNYIQTLFKAIENNQPQAIKLLKEWGASDYARMVVNAIETNNNTDNIKLFKKLGGDYNLALTYAAKDGKLLVMNVLKSWGATDYNSAFIAAIDNGQLDAMKLVHDHWGADDYYWGLVHAAKNGQLKAMRLLHDWGADNYDRALISAAEHGKVPAMRLLKKWGAKNYDLPLIYAAKTGQLEAINLLDTWGVTYYDQAITVALENEQIEAANLLKRLDKFNLQFVIVH